MEDTVHMKEHHIFENKLSLIKFYIHFIQITIGNVLLSSSILNTFGKSFPSHKDIDCCILTFVLIFVLVHEMQCKTLLHLRSAKIDIDLVTWSFRDRNRVSLY